MARPPRSVSPGSLRHRAREHGRQGRWRADRLGAGHARRGLPVALVAAVVLGVASSVGAQVDVAGRGPAVWAASCVSPGAVDLAVYGRGWAAGPVGLEVLNQADEVVGVGAATASGGSGGAGVFQARVAMGVDAGEVRLVATQAGGSVQHGMTVRTCSPTVTAVAGAPCALPGRPVGVTVTVRGAPTSAFDLLLHHVDLYGPAESIDRSQPARPTGDYAIALTVPNVPDRVVPVTVEARRPGGGFAYATTTVNLPPACAQPGTTAPTSPPTVPGTTSPTTATATPPTTTASPGPVVTLPPFPFRPGLAPGLGQRSLALVPALGRPGEATTVVGRGFPPSSTVTLRWRPGIGQWTVRAGGDGTFRTQVLVLPKDIEGRRVLEVLEGGATPAPYLVVPGSDQPAFNGVFVGS